MRRCLNVFALRKISASGVLPLLFWATLLGCGEMNAPAALGADTGGVAGAADLVSLVSRELDFVSRTMTFTTAAALFIAVSTAAALLVLLTRILGRLKKRYRLDTPEFTAATLLTLVLFVGLLIGLLFHFFFVRTPFVATIGVVAAVFGIAFVLFRSLPAWGVGFGMILKRSIKKGDLVQVGEIRGVVRSLGALRVVLTDAEGARIHVGLGELGKAPLTVSSPTTEHLVEYVYRGVAPLDDRVLEIIKTIAVLCPYRTAKSQVRMETRRDGPNEVVIRFHTWSANAQEHALVYLKRTVGMQLVSRDAPPGARSPEKPDVLS